MFEKTRDRLKVLEWLGVDVSGTWEELDAIERNTRAHEQALQREAAERRDAEVNIAERWDRRLEELVERVCGLETIVRRLEAARIDRLSVGDVVLKLDRVADLVAEVANRATGIENKEALANVARSVTHDRLTRIERFLDRTLKGWDENEECDG